MAIFEYRATDTNGRRVAGTLVGSTFADAAQALQTRGLNVEHLAPAGVSHDPIAPPATRPQTVASASTDPSPVMADKTRMARVQTAIGYGGVPLEKLMIFFRQLASMIRAGVPIVQTLSTLSGQARNPKLERILIEAANGAKTGQPMSETFRKYPEVFTPLMTSMVIAGEKGGFLDTTCKNLSQYLEREVNLRNLYKRLTFMPKLQILASMAIIVVANGIIAGIPGADKSFLLSSPLTTISTWYWLGPLLLFIAWFWHFGLNMERIRIFWDMVKIRTPYIGGINQRMAMARFGRAFGALFEGGVPLPTAYEQACEACGNAYVQDRIFPAIEQLKSGKSFTDAISETGAFSQIVVDMARTGEFSGRLASSLEDMARYYEDEAETQQTKLAIVTGLVAFFIVAIYIGSIIFNFYGGMASRYSDALVP